jgi:DnaD/phage-associated family protein
MKRFAGFPKGSKLSTTAFPTHFFSDLLPMIDDLAELKIALFCFWALHQKQGRVRYLRRCEFATPELLEGMRNAQPDRDPQDTLTEALERSLQRGTLLRATVTLNGQVEHLYFVNTELGRIAFSQLEAGQWYPGEGVAPFEILPERPNIYKLYEDNIGLLSPMTAESLKDAERDYPLEWIVDAIREAVKSEKRNWRYILSILKRWESEGRSGGFAGRRAEPTGLDYISGPYADFIEH